ncbi:MAG: PKD domain-containing protein [Syntrophales bacterium]|jgi:PKD repeat protein|nr:PKD domain-containing protein [Syntrophales bacterium]
MAYVWRKLLLFVLSVLLVVTAAGSACAFNIYGSTTAYEGDTKNYYASGYAPADDCWLWVGSGTSTKMNCGANYPVTFPSPGTYTINGSSKDNGTGATWNGIPRVVTVSARPAPTVTLAGPTTSYTGETKQYTVTHNSNIPVTIAWSVDGTVISGSTGSSADIPFATAGSYNIAVTVFPTGYPGSVSTTTKTVTVTPPAPTVTLADHTTAYVGDTKQYSVTHDSSYPVTISWTLNGTVIEGATGTSVDIPFATAGTQSVGVKVYPTGYPTVVSTKATSVVVSEYPAPVITMTGPTTSIAGETKQYSVTHNSSIPVTISWTLNGTGIDGVVGTSVDIPFPTMGTQNVSVTVFPIAYPNSKATGSKVVTVTAPPAPTITMAGPRTSIEGEAKQYTVTYHSIYPVTIEWSLNNTVIDGADGTSVDITFATAGTQNVVVKVYPTAYPNSSKTGSIPVVVSAYPAPTIALAGPRKSVEGETKQYSVTHNASLPVTIAWSLNGTVIEGAIGTSIDIPFATSGNSTVAVTVYPTAYPNSERTETIPVVVTEYPKATVSIEGPRTSTAGNTERYTATVGSNAPVTVEWDVNGTKYQGNQIDVPFATVGSYDVVVTAYPTAYPKSAGTSQITVVVMTVRAPLVSISSIKSGFVDTPINLSATAKSMSPGVPLVVKWDLPDGTSVNALTTTYTPRLEDLGKATFKFTAYPEEYPDNKKEAVVIIPITQYEFPTFTLKNYTKNTGIVPWTVVYAANANLQGITTEQLSYTWDMGEGAVMPNKNKATYTYTQPGTYTVSLTVADTRGNSSVVTDEVTVTSVSPISVDSITVKGTNKYMRSPVVGIFKTTVSGGNPRIDRYTIYAWTVNDQPVGRNSSTATYTFTEPGTYTVGLTVTSKSGLTGSGTATVVVNENTPPECSIEATDYPDRKYTKLLASCTDSDGRIKELSWALGNGQTKNTGTVYATYAESGTYKVSLTATDDSGGTVTVSQDVTVQR